MDSKQKEWDMGSLEIIKDAYAILNSFDKGTNNTQICGIQTIKTYYQK